MENLQKQLEIQVSRLGAVLRENIWRTLSLGLLGILIFLYVFEVNITIHRRNGQNITVQEQANLETETSAQKSDIELAASVTPDQGVVLPVIWGDLGKRMVEAGVIDSAKFEALYAQRGGLDEAAKQLLYGENNGSVKMDAQNSGVILNLLWAFGLANQNRILEEGPMVDAQYGGDASRFASTGGWTLAKGNTMDHYSKYPLVILTQEQQELIERVSKNIYRPCCGNSVYFPDCNHGMAMLGLLELLAAQGASEEEMYAIALQVNSYWFPSTYITLAKYFDEREVAWEDVSAKMVLGSAYSGASGYRQILAEVEPAQVSGGGSCGV